MRYLRAVTKSSTYLCWLILGVGMARADDISGPIDNTLTILEDSSLVGDVTCTMKDSPCIAFGAANITLRLNGFTITGPASPDSPPNLDAHCNATSGLPAADGIHIVNQTEAAILGPGMVQKFRRHGILIVGTIGISTQARVKRVTSHHNCFSGVLTNAMSDSVIEEIVSVRNANNSGPAPCGGNCLVNSHNNSIRRSFFGGNGSVDSGSNDFGIGLLFGSSGNLLDRNNIGGNTNGILIHANAVNNVVRRNIVAGNPPGQVSRTFGGMIGFDIRDDSSVPGAGSRNAFQKNWCITYSGPGPAPCPNFPRRGDDDDDDDDDDEDEDEDDAREWRKRFQGR